MQILLDNGVPRGIAASLRPHKVKECRTLGWDALRNGELLEAAEAGGFDVFVTTDKNLRYQQNLSQRKLSIVVLGKGRWRLIRPVLSLVSAAVNATTPGSFTEVEIPDI